MYNYHFIAKSYPDDYFKMVGIVVDGCTNIYGSVYYPYVLDREKHAIHCKLSSNRANAIHETCIDAGIKVEMKST